MVICLEQGADLHTAQLIPLPLTVSCSSKIQIGFTFLVPAHLGSPRERAVKQVCVCVLQGEPGSFSCLSSLDALDVKERLVQHFCAWMSILFQQRNSLLYLILSSSSNHSSTQSYTNKIVKAFIRNTRWAFAPSSDTFPQKSPSQTSAHHIYPNANQGALSVIPYNCFWGRGQVSGGQMPDHRWCLSI